MVVELVDEPVVGFAPGEVDAAPPAPGVVVDDPLLLVTSPGVLAVAIPARAFIRTYEPPVGLAAAAPDGFGRAGVPAVAPGVVEPEVPTGPDIEPLCWRHPVTVIAPLAFTAELCDCAWAPAASATVMTIPPIVHVLIMLSSTDRTCST